MNDLNQLLEFILKFSERMLVSGANLERLDDSVYRICDAYGCQDVHFFSLNCYVSLCMKDAEGNKAMGQRCIWSGTDTHLENLSRLNQLSRRICAEPPEPAALEGMLNEAVNTKGYSQPMLLVGFLLAMAGLTGVFGGSMGDLVVVLFNTVLMFLAGLYLKRLIFNKVVFNVLCTFVVGSIAIGAQAIGLASDLYTVMIVNSMMVIPGISMVNSFRNILCGNEINGLVEFFKVILETMAIVGGFILSIYLFGRTIA
ncbi:MAG: threonine/serine exporter family protein [Clostridiales bacterium]|nr:threonine/serine exporter family protein [Clostridiales bacterium]